MKEHPDSMLVQFCGVHSLVSPVGEVIYFMVMRNSLSKVADDRHLSHHRTRFLVAVRSATQNVAIVLLLGWCAPGSLLGEALPFSKPGSLRRADFSFVLVAEFFSA